jgi:nucleoside-diphosphate-sugar epimerase
MRLLLDVHHSRHAAERLRNQGHDVVAATDDESLRDAADEELLALATVDSRVVVSENVKDFDRLVRQWAESGTHHAGVIFTSPRRFHRGSSAYPDNLVKALGAFLATAPEQFTDQVHWL